MANYWTHLAKYHLTLINSIEYILTVETTSLNKQIQMIKALKIASGIALPPQPILTCRSTCLEIAL